MSRRDTKPDSFATLAIEALRVHGPMKPRQLSALLEVKPRLMHANMRHSIRSGRVLIDLDTGEWSAPDPHRAGFEFAMPIGVSVSVRRPNVARDVWQFAQGAA